MSSHLWKVSANKNWGKVLKGMAVEVMVKNRSGKPSIKQIQEALEEKYSIKIGGGLPQGTSDFQEG